jgi:uroporphyrinogen decarboxylase
MRQAGRFLPEYRALREKHSMLETCKDGELVMKATRTAIDALPGLDAAIIFSDILLVLEPMGIEIDYIKGAGPVVKNPVRSHKAVLELKPVNPTDDLKGVLNGIAFTRSDLPKEMALIGFAGGPFTLASYLVKGGPSKDYLAVKSMMAQAPKTWHRLMDKLVDVVTAHLKAQIAAGADIVQLFDSWAGALTPDDYREYVLPYSKKILDEIQETRTPAIHFGTNTAGMLEVFKEAGGDVISVDWRIRLDEAWSRLGDVAIQGNLDPIALFAPKDVLLKKVDAVLDAAGGRPGHIFNLGHGILPKTPVENVVAVIEHVHQRSAK